MKKVIIASLILLIVVFGALFILLENNNSEISENLNINQQDPKRVVVYGDSRSGHDYHQKVVDVIIQQNPEAVFHTGDLVNDSTISDEWKTFNEITAEMVASTDFYPALGNHEKNSDLYFNNFILPGNERWYNVDIGESTFFVLDSSSGLEQGSEQYSWLEEQLSNYDANDLLVAILHHPPYSTGTHDPDEINSRESIVPLFEKYGVDIVFAGHDHTYERTIVNGVYYIVTGGGGAPQYGQTREDPNSQVFLNEYHFCYLEISGNTMNIKVYNIDSEVIDEYKIN